MARPTSGLTIAQELDAWRGYAEDARERVAVLEAEVTRLTAGWAAQMAAPCPVCAPVFAAVERLREALDVIATCPPDLMPLAAQAALRTTAAQPKEPT